MTNGNERTDEVGYPKFQYSVFTKNGVNGQYVVRTNDKGEFEDYISYLNTLVSKYHQQFDSKDSQEPEWIKEGDKTLTTTKQLCEMCQADTERKEGDSQYGHWIGYKCVTGRHMGFVQEKDGSIKWKTSKA